MTITREYHEDRVNMRNDITMTLALNSIVQYLMDRREAEQIESIKMTTRDHAPAYPFPSEIWCCTHATPK